MIGSIVGSNHVCVFLEGSELSTLVNKRGETSKKRGWILNRSIWMPLEAQLDTDLREFAGSFFYDTFRMKEESHTIGVCVNLSSRGYESLLERGIASEHLGHGHLTMVDVNNPHVMDNTEQKQGGITTNYRAEYNFLREIEKIA